MDENGERNEQSLKRMAGNKLWWVPDGSMYVYYTPTHYLEDGNKFSANLNDYRIK